MKIVARKSFEDNYQEKHRQNEGFKLKTVVLQSQLKNANNEELNIIQFNNLKKKYILDSLKMISILVRNHIYWLR